MVCGWWLKLEVADDQNAAFVRHVESQHSVGSSYRSTESCTQPVMKGKQKAAVQVNPLRSGAVLDGFGILGHCGK